MQQIICPFYFFFRLHGATRPPSILINLESRFTMLCLLRIHKTPAFACLIAMVCLSLAFMYTIRDTRLEARYVAGLSNETIQLQKYGYERVERRAFVESNPSRRTNIVILSLPRSGSSFLGDVFNHHPQVLYLFEPLHSLQLNIQKSSIFHFDFTRESYKRSALKFLDDAMSCNFVQGEFASNMNVNDRYRSFALTSTEFCSGNATSRVCEDVDPVRLEALCKNNYSVLSLKILTPRLLDVQDKGHLLPSCSNPYSECKIMHLVRDPRAVIASLMFSVHFFSRRWETRHQLSWYAQKICHQLESDVTLGKLTANSQSSSYRLIRFEDLAKNPLSQVNELFKFAGIEMTDGVRKWLNEATHSSDITQTNVQQAYLTSRDSEKVVSEWRSRMESATVQIIERYCGRVMKNLGYKLIGISPDKQRNFNISVVDPIAWFTY